VEARLVAVLRAAEVRYKPAPGEADAGGFRLSPNALIIGDDIKQVLSRGPEDNIRALRDQVVERIESPQYVVFAAGGHGA
jgi:hypothetical protein